MRRLAADSRSIRHGSSSMFARESDAVSPRLGRCTILVCAARTSRVTRRASRVVRDSVAIGAHSCASGKQWCVKRPRLVCLSVAWRHSNSSGSGTTTSIIIIVSGRGGANNLDPVRLLRGGVRGEGSRGGRSRLRRELARRSARRRCVSAVSVATAARTR